MTMPELTVNPSCKAGRRGGVVNDDEADGKPLKPSEVKE
jgi:hypothetical protein